VSDGPDAEGVVDEAIVDDGSADSVALGRLVTVSELSAGGEWRARRCASLLERFLGAQFVSHGVALLRLVRNEGRDRPLFVNDGSKEVNDALAHIG
jgi:hypothetical protein